MSSSGRSRSSSRRRGWKRPLHCRRGTSGHTGLQ